MSDMTVERSIDIDDFPMESFAFPFMRLSEALTVWPNKSPEPTGVGAGRYSRRFPLCHIAGRPWLSFFR